MIEQTAMRLAASRRTLTQCASPSSAFASPGIDTAYAIQRAVTEELTSTDGEVIGYKIGLTNPAVWSKLGLQGPFAAPLLADWHVRNGWIDLRCLIQPAIELELVLRCAVDAPAPDQILERPAEVFDAMATGFEIIDSRIEAGVSTGFDLIADGGATGLIACGDFVALRREFDFATLMASIANAQRVLVAGDAGNCMGNPCRAVAELARLAAPLGRALQKGDLIFSGAICALKPVPAGILTGEICGLPSLQIEVTSSL